MKEKDFKALRQKSKSLLNDLYEIEIPDGTDLEKASAIFRKVMSLMSEAINFYSDNIANENLNHEQKLAIANDYAEFNSAAAFTNSCLVGVSLETSRRSEENYSVLKKGWTDWKEEETANFKSLEQETRKILPEIITFCSLFVAVIGLIVANLSASNDYSLKNTLIINLTFLLSICIIFGIFALILPESILKSRRRLTLIIVFLIVIVALIIAILHVALWGQ